MSNLFTGPQAGNANTTGNQNLFSGQQSGQATTTGSNNVFEGFQSGQYNATGSNNTALGAGAGPASGSDALTNATALGANAQVTASNSLVLGNNANVGIGTTAPTSTLQVAGTVAVGVVMGLNGSPAGTPLVGGGYLGLNPASGNDYYLLPAASSCMGRIYYIRNNSSSNIAYIGTNGGAIFEGGATTAAGAPYFMQTSGLTKTVTMISDGVNWTLIKSGN